MIGPMLVGTVATKPTCAQTTVAQYGRRVPSSVRLMNERGLRFLAATQRADGGWDAEQAGPGIDGICVMAFLAGGQDPNFGPYAGNIRRALRFIVTRQDLKTGYLGASMYHHGFATLCLSEAYGVVHDRLLWQGSDVPSQSQRPLGQALELAVRCSVTAQKRNSWHAWRYSPEHTNADTTVSGTVFMGILGAKNAGIAVPNQSVEKALGFFKAHTLPDGTVTYQGMSSHGNSMTRSSIATLVYAMAKRKDWPQYKATSAYIAARIDEDVTQFPLYCRYYVAQALFHSDIQAWERWNQRTIKQLQEMQQDDGSFPSNRGNAYGTGMSLLALALNYRLLPVYER